MSEISKGDLVRFKSGKYVVTTQKKRIEYDLKDHIGKVKNVFDGGVVCEVNILLDGMYYDVKVACSDLLKFDPNERYGRIPFDVTKSFSNLIKKWENEHSRVLIKFDVDAETAEKIRKNFMRGNVPVLHGLEPAQKMTKARCIKLLESYRAEREKIAKGRKFERCLRDSVVNEALERAIELLKGNE